jgi:hypothetical protein
MFGCKNGTTPEPVLCECPAGTIHEPGVECCDGEDCTCKEVKYYNNFTLDGKVIPVEDRSGQDNVAINDIQTEFDNAQFALGGNFSKVKTNLSKVYIISGSSYRDGTGVYVKFDRITDDLMVLLDQMGIDPSLAYNRENSNTHLANGRNVNVDQIIAFGRQFGTAKRIVRDAFRRQGQA